MHHPFTKATTIRYTICRDTETQSLIYRLANHSLVFLCLCFYTEKSRNLSLKQSKALNS